MTMNTERRWRLTSPSHPPVSSPHSLRTHAFLFRAIVCTLALRLLGAFAPATHVVPNLGGAGNCLACR